MAQTAQSSPRSQHPSFVRDRPALERARIHAKQRACPHCGRLGTLNGHGVLRSYGECGEPGVVRGRRLFCSNRGRRPGCGRTVSVLLARVIAGFVVTTRILARFVEAVLTGRSRHKAWSTAAGTLSLSSGYRLWRRLNRAQPGWRAALRGHSPPPDVPAAEPLAQVWAHLGEVAPSPEPFAGYQLRFGQSLL